MSNKRALVMSYSTIESDPRVLRQIEWLTTDGWSVDTVGWGRGVPGKQIRHFRVSLKPLPIRLSIYALLKGPLRYKYLVRGELPNKSDLGVVKYDLVIANDLDFLPWCQETLQSMGLTYPETRWHLDLHEYFGDQGHGMLWKLLFRKYHQWLFTFAKSSMWSSRSTVAEGIAHLYKDFAGFAEMKIVRNTPKLAGLAPVLPAEQRIKLVYHGRADLDRGLEDLVRIVTFLDERFELHLLLMGDNRAIRKLHKLVASTGVQERVFFHQPVSVQEIPRTINPFDLEVIFYPPKTENLRHALPNKFFEAVQAGIGVVIGDSPNMRAIVDQENLGLVVDGWSWEDLVSALNGLNREKVNQFKINAAAAAKKLNSEYEGISFLREIACR